MTGFVAVVDVHRRSPVVADDLEALVAAYEAVRGPGARAVVRAGDFCRAAELPRSGAKAGTVHAGSSWLVTAGTPYGRGGGPLTRPPTSQELRDLDGQFGLIAFDSDADELIVAGDPLGMFAVYVAERQGRVYVSTSSLALARLLGTPADRLSLQAFVLSGYHFGSRTHWQGVRRLDPGRALHFTVHGQREAAYWRPSVDDQVRRLPFTRAVDHCLDVSVDALRTRLGDGRDTWSDLTGGYDSRLLNLLLHRAGVPVRANTRHTTEPAEIRIAGEIAAMMGWEWSHPPLPDDWDDVLPSVVPRSLAWGDAQLEVLQLSRVLWVHERLATSVPSLLSGGGGEHFQYAGWKSEFGAAGRSNRVNFDNFINMRMLKPVDRSVLAASPVGAVRDDFRSRMSAWVADYSCEVNTTQLDLMYAYKSTGHFGAYRCADDGVLSAQLPFYFRPLFEAAFSTNYRHRNSHRLMRHMIERLSPAIAALGTTRGGPAQPLRVSNVHRFLPYYQQLGRKAVTKMSEKLLGRSLLLQSQSFPWSARANTKALASLAASGSFRPGELRTGSLYRPQELEALLARTGAGDFTQNALLGRIITLELALALANADVG